MTKKEVASLALKLLGLYAFIVSISMLQTIVFAIRTSIQTHTMNLLIIIIGVLIPLILMITFGIYLIKTSDKLSNKIFTGIENDNKAIKLSLSAVQSIAFSVIGVFLITNAIPKLFQKIAQLLLLALIQERVLLENVRQRLAENLLEIIIQLILGFYLFLGSESISKLWRKIHSMRSMQS